MNWAPYRGALDYNLVSLVVNRALFEPVDQPCRGIRWASAQRGYSGYSTDCRSVQEPTTAVVSFFSYINVLQGSVATQLKCGEIFDDHFIANFPQSVSVKSFFLNRRY